MSGGGAGGGPSPVDGVPVSPESYQWAYSIMDSSRVSTFFISILLIVYGSFRSLALEEDKDGEFIYALHCFSDCSNPKVRLKNAA